MKLSFAKDKLLNLINNGIEVAEVPSMQDVLPIVIGRRIVSGCDMIEYHCYQCGNSGMVDRSWYRITCPSCGNNSRWDKPTVWEHDDGYRLPAQWVHVFYVEDDCAFFRMYSPSLTIEGDDLHHKVFKTSRDVSDLSCTYGFILKGYGICFRVDDRWSLTGSKCDSYKNLLSLCFSEGRVMGDIPAIERFLSPFGFHRVSDMVENEAQSRPVKKPSVKKDVFNTDLPALDVHFDTRMHLFMVLNSDGVNEDTLLYCPVDKVVRKESHSDERKLSRYNMQCPGCGKVFSASDSASEQFAILEGSEDALVIRVYCSKTALKANATLNQHIVEESRFFINASRMEYHKAYCGQFEKEVLRLNGSLYGWSNVLWVQSADEIKAELQKSPLKYASLDLIMQNPAFSFLDLLRYVKLWQKRPLVESVVKCGLIKYLKDELQDATNPSALLSGSSILNAFGVNKQQFAILRSLNPNRQELYLLLQFFKVKPSLTVEEYKQIERRLPSNRLGQVINLVERYSISFDQVVRYLDSCYQYQCIEKAEALQIWSDYLRMAHDMHFDFKQKEVRTPSSLKKEHDKATFAYKAIVSAERSRVFHERTRGYQQYSYQKGDLLVAIPEKPEDLTQEGSALHHCVKSYIQPVIDASTQVVFIRRKDSPEESFYTVEVKDKRIVQVRGLYNCVATKEVKDFVSDWARAKKLEVAV